MGKIYLRRNGNMVFWRMGRLGGSFYLSKSTDRERETRKAMRRHNREARRAELIRLRMAYYRRSFVGAD